MPPMLRSLLSAPVFPGDESRTRTARLLRTLLLAFAGMTLAFGLAGVLWLHAPNLLLCIAIARVLEAGMLLALRAGYVTIAALGFTAFPWLITTGTSVLNGGEQQAAGLEQVALAM